MHLETERIFENITRVIINIKDAQNITYGNVDFIIKITILVKICKLNTLCSKHKSVAGFWLKYWNLRFQSLSNPEI
jgi:hypothetical protein